MAPLSINEIKIGIGVARRAPRDQDYSQKHQQQPNHCGPGLQHFRHCLTFLPFHATNPIPRLKPTDDMLGTSHRSCYRGNENMIRGPSFRPARAAPSNHLDAAMSGRAGLPAGYWVSVPPSGHGIPGKTRRRGMSDRDSAPVGYRGHGTSQRQWSD